MKAGQILVAGAVVTAVAITSNAVHAKKITEGLNIKPSLRLTKNSPWLDAKTKFDLVERDSMGMGTNIGVRNKKPTENEQFKVAQLPPEETSSTDRNMEMVPKKVENNEITSREIDELVMDYVTEIATSDSQNDEKLDKLKEIGKPAIPALLDVFSPTAKMQEGDEKMWGDYFQTISREKRMSTYEILGNTLREIMEGMPIKEGSHSKFVSKNELSQLVYEYVESTPFQIDMDMPNKLKKIGKPAIFALLDVLSPSAKIFPGEDNRAVRDVYERLEIKTWGDYHKFYGLSTTFDRFRLVANTLRAILGMEVQISKEEKETRFKVLDCITGDSGYEDVDEIKKLGKPAVPVLMDVFSPSAVTFDNPSKMFGNLNDSGRRIQQYQAAFALKAMGPVAEKATMTLVDNIDARSIMLTEEPPQNSYTKAEAVQIYIRRALGEIGRPAALRLINAIRNEYEDNSEPIVSTTYDAGVDIPRNRIEYSYGVDSLEEVSSRYKNNWENKIIAGIGSTAVNGEASSELLKVLKDPNENPNVRILIALGLGNPWNMSATDDHYSNGDLQSIIDNEPSLPKELSEALTNAIDRMDSIWSNFRSNRGYY